MIEFKRNAFKATSTSSMKVVKEKEDALIPKAGGRTDRIELEDGLNKMRIFPAHPGEENFYHILSQHWITITDDKGEEQRRTVINAKVHAGWSNDIFDAYIQYVRENLSSTDAEDSAKIKKLTDSYNGGLVMQTSWLCYAKQIKKNSADVFGLYEFKKTVRDSINDESIIEDEDESISVDPFTDPDDGKLLLVTYNSKAKKAADYYKVQIGKNASPLSDDELEKFSKLTPLSQLDFLHYTPEMFEMALEGIEFFDAEQEINLFDSDDFQSIIEELRENFNTPKETKKAASKPTVKKNQKEEELDEEEEEVEEVEEVEEEEDGDKFSSMDRTELKKYIASQSLDIKVLKSMEDEDIRNAIRAIVEEEVEEVEEVEEEEDEIPAKEEPKKKKSLEDIKAELRAKSKK